MYRIETLSDNHIESFRQAVGSVSREKQFLTFLDAPSIEMTQQFIQMMRKHNMPQFVALSEADQVVGWCDISPKNRPVFNHIGELGMGVIDGHRGKGLGEQLIRTALDTAKRRGLTRIELTVRHTNIPAQRLYEKMGFQLEGKHKNAVLIDGEYFDHISMALLYPPSPKSAE
jgi:RimJ/RimL family protein N-acetyltransferase